MQGRSSRIVCEQGVAARLRYARVEDFDHGVCLAHDLCQLFAGLVHMSGVPGNGHFLGLREGDSVARLAGQDQLHFIDCELRYTEGD